MAPIPLSRFPLCAGVKGGFCIGLFTGSRHDKTMSIFRCLVILFCPLWLWATPPCSERISEAFTALNTGDLYVLSDGQAREAHQKIHQLVFKDFPKYDSKLGEQQIREYLVGLELGSELDFHAQWLKSEFIKRLSCDPGVAVDTKSQGVHQNKSKIKINVGAQRAFTTAYQSCEVWSRRPLTALDPDVEGIIITGTHPDGVGSRREIGSLSQVQSTHPYLNVSYRGGCYSVRNNPLIYDYGGKPYADTARGTLNFFKNSGSGTSVLGTDCSGYVFAAITSVGARLKVNEDPKAYQINGVPARMYIDPSKSGLSCFEKVEIGYQSQLQSGDLVANRGHIFIVDHVGRDPFGFLKLSSIDQCHGLSLDDLDFTLTQSSTSKMGVGINKYQARDYVPTNPSFSETILDYAQRACRAHFEKQTAPHVHPDLGIVRLKLDAGCRATKPLSLVGSACVSSCWSE